ncbi:hypothetical protein ALI22I_01425 [Saccharothrix sp. ALI-22-I]|uniref:hypothetical protein n=1 Tax=Saccharothrix sp. ALI-22-I TaxID=1933778 RepID=UPI00097C95C3|nr:hypothetical protein [Saccharothrix sp. ALI-22-I]ONI92865.1 hypothetical protein ALI22I_01425 [Saccharothrix sp. ALI-22-I]
MTAAFTELRAADIPVTTSCALTGTSRATHYRHADRKGPLHGPWLPAARRRTPWTPPSARVLRVSTSPAYRDLAIPQPDSSVLGCVTDGPNVVSTGCGIEVPYATT